MGRSLRAGFADTGVQSFRAAVPLVSKSLELSFGPEARVSELVDSRLIDTYWRDVGGTYSEFGRPRSEVLTPTPSGTVREYTGGYLKTEGDGTASGAVSVSVTLTCTRLFCNTEVDSGWWDVGEGDSDEPYLILVTFDPSRPKDANVDKFGTFYDVDSDENCEINKAFWVNKPPNELRVSCLLMDENHGNPDEVRKQVEDAVKDAGNIAAAAEGVTLPPDWLEQLPLGGALVGGITEALGLEDERIGEGAITFTQEMLRTGLPADDSDFLLVRELPTPCYVNGRGAAYEVYFAVTVERKRLPSGWA